MQLGGEMRYNRNLLFVLTTLFALSLAFAACSREPEEKPAAKPAAQSAADASTKTVRAPSPPSTAIEVSGKVLEVLDGGNFIFVLIDRGDQQTWATMPITEIEVGENISLDNATQFGKFYSKALDRTFDSLIFASAVTGRKPMRPVSRMDPGQRRSGRLLPAPDPQPADQEVK
jgi:hypothetical protein